MWHALQTFDTTLLFDAPDATKNLTNSAWENEAIRKIGNVQVAAVNKLEQGTGRQGAADTASEEYSTVKTDVTD